MTPMCRPPPPPHRPLPDAAVVVATRCRWLPCYGCSGLMPTAATACCSTAATAVCFHGCHGGLFSRLHNKSCHGCIGAAAAKSCLRRRLRLRRLRGSVRIDLGTARRHAPAYTLHGYNQGGMYGWSSPRDLRHGDEPQSADHGRAHDSSERGAEAGTDADARRAGPDAVPVEERNGLSQPWKFRLPAESKLYVDGRLIPVGGTEPRVFTTPQLTPGQKYFYDVKAELAVNGAVVVQEMRVIVESGAHDRGGLPRSCSPRSRTSRRRSQGSKGKPGTRDVSVVLRSVVVGRKRPATTLWVLWRLQFLL